MIQKRKVAFVVPYLGQWPRWAELFFLSVARNPAIEVLLVAEQAPSLSLPENVTCLRTGREEILRRLNDVTGLSLDSISGHKLCDFRPFFGLAFSDLLQSFEFWGFCDIDLMFGDLSSITSDEALASTDLFTAHDSQLAGHCSFFRNTGELNRAGFRIEGWQAKCLQPQTCLMEELDFPEALRRDGSIRWIRPGRLDQELERDFCRFGITFDFAGKLAHSSSGAAAMVRWSEGRAFFSDSAGRRAEVLYVHFMGLKRWWHWVSLRAPLASQDEHRFSRVGYGGPRSASALVTSPWKQIYGAQVALASMKSRAGGLARGLLPERTFRRLRRTLLGRGRY